MVGVLVGQQDKVTASVIKATKHVKPLVVFGQRISVVCKYIDKWTLVL